MTDVSPRSPLLKLEAIALIVLGVAALVLPIAAGLAVSLVIGIVLIVSGAIGVISAMRGGAHLHRGWSLASAIIALLIGLLIVFNPFAGTLTLALLLAVYLLLDGISLIGLSMDQRRRTVSRWGLLLAAGVVDILLALLLLFLGAVGSAAVVGVIVGIDLILAGAALLMIHRLPTPGVLAGRLV